MKYSKGLSPDMRSNNWQEGENQFSLENNLLIGYLIQCGQPLNIYTLNGLSWLCLCIYMTCLHTTRIIKENNSDNTLKEKKGSEVEEEQYVGVGCDNRELMIKV